MSEITRAAQHHEVMAVIGKPKPGKQPKKAKNPPIDKAAILAKRYGIIPLGYPLIRCECGCGKPGHDLHHIIGRKKGFPVLDDERNLILVNHEEHDKRTFDNITWRARLWVRQIERFGIKAMGEYTDLLIAAGLENRLDFLP